MNSFNPQTFKKLLLVFAFSILIIFIFLLARMFFQVDKEIELKSFNTKKAHKTSLNQELNQTQSQKKFMLLPAN